jgi:dissimilatory sulfite reductase (desulfoviridin) alpha/beta subunit
MIDKIRYLEDGKNKYPIAFTLNVMESLEDEYGGLKQWVELIDSDEPSYKAIKFMVQEVIGEGQDILNQSDDKLSSKEIGRLISRIGMEKVGEEIFKLIKESLPEAKQGKNKIPMQRAKK